MVGVGVVGPVLFAPQPLASTNEIGTESQNIIDEMVLGSSSVVGIVLHIQTNQRLGKTVDNGQSPRGSIGHPQILQVKEKGDVKDATSIPSVGSKFPATSDNLENFALDFSLKLGIELVSIVGKAKIMTAKGSVSKLSSFVFQP